MNSGQAILMGAFIGFVLTSMVYIIIEHDSNITRYNCNYSCFPLQTIMCDEEHAGCSDNSVHELKARK